MPEKRAEDAGGSSRCARARHAKHIDEVPEHLRYNKFIISHYRGPMSWLECLASIGWLHNETFNVLTHLLPLGVALPYLSALLNELPRRAPHYSVLVPLVSSMALVLMLSCAYHVFMPAVGTKVAYDRLLFVDVFGVWLLMTLAALVSVVAGFPCEDPTLTAGVSALFPAIGLIMLFAARSAGQRAVAFAVMTAGRTAGNVARLTAGHSSLNATLVLLGAECLVAGGGLINAVRVPERYASKGRLDLGVNSHQLMHVMTAIGMLVMVRAVEIDCDHMWAHAQLRECVAEHSVFTSMHSAIVNAWWGGYRPALQG